MTERVPYIGFGNETLGKNPVLNLGQRIVCPGCGKQHRVRGGRNEDGQEHDLLMYYQCGGHAYICGVRGRSVLGVKADVSGEVGE